MEVNQIRNFALEKVQALFAKHSEYVQIKNELFAEIQKSTIGKANLGDDNIKSAQKWLAFTRENPDWITKKLNVSDFERMSDAADLLELIEKLESDDAALSKVIHGIIASDMRFFWSTAEGFYDDAAVHDNKIKEKYKDLPSISPQRRSDSQIEKDFRKLEEKRNKKNGTGGVATPQ